MASLVLSSICVLLVIVVPFLVLRFYMKKQMEILEYAFLKEEEEKIKLKKKESANSVTTFGDELNDTI